MERTFRKFGSPEVRLIFLYLKLSVACQLLNYVFVFPHLRSQQIKKNVVDVFPLMLRPTGGISFYHPYDSSKRNANFDEIDRYGFQKRNFDEIDRYGFKKRNFDEIDRYGFKKRDFDDDRTRALRDYLKRGGRLVPSSNFDEIDRSGFNAKRFDEIDRWGMPMSG